MVTNLHCIGLFGIEAFPVQVEADVSDGFPGFTMVGYLSSEVKEAQDRVKSALRNSGFRIGPKRITINLSPADQRKEGTGYDLAIAIGILAGISEILPSSTTETAFFGELGLSGEIKGIRGILALVLFAKEIGMKRCFVPGENEKEANVVDGIQIIGVRHLKQVILYLRKPELIPAYLKPSASNKSTYPIDYSDVNGQYVMKRATEIAVAGNHNIFYIGPPGTGKTMIAKRIPTIMPDLSFEEQLNISKIYSICGYLSQEQPLLIQPPFRNPFQTVTPQALSGGGSRPRPGEFSLAGKGVLFFDELPEFSRQAIELLRQPLEEHKILISRSYGTFSFPTEFLFAATMNPCPCGYHPDKQKCNCTPAQIKRYLKKISRPLLDRIDICVESSPSVYNELATDHRSETSGQIGVRVEAARAIQKQRFQERKCCFNSYMTPREITKYCKLGQSQRALLKNAFATLRLSNRSYYKILKVARTIADLEASEDITNKHLGEAIGYRGVEEKYWGEPVYD